MPTIGVVALARPTFDVPFAEQMAREAFGALDSLSARIVGPRELLFDAAETEKAIGALRGRDLDLMLVLQVTFTDASMTVALARQVSAPLALWAFPEPRTGGRLRLNGLCGINLAAHAWGQTGRTYSYLYCTPGPEVLPRLREILAGNACVPCLPSPVVRSENPSSDVAAKATRIAARLREARVGLIGEHPVGFDTCRYDPDELSALTGVQVEHVELPALFTAARGVTDTALAAVRHRADSELAGLDKLEQEPLNKSLKLYTALRGLADAEAFAGMAVRCWPEAFTDYGCAACGPMAMLNQDMTPCACEADVYGNVTTLMLQWAADRPALMADLVDIDVAGDSGVFWHCGLAPIDMADPEFQPRGGLHSNRVKPLLNEFPLKPGRITIARLSQARGQKTLVLAGGEMLRAPMSFSGTSGVVRFDQPAGLVLDRILGEALEHHFGFVYGEHRPVLRALASQLGLATMELT